MTPIKNKIDICHLLVIALLLLIAVNHITLLTNSSYNPFESIDPSSYYFSSALELLESGKAFFNKNPGPPYYIFLAFMLLPLKLYTLFSNIDLVEFVYLNIGPILIYLQLATMSVFLFGLYLISRTVARLTRAEWPGLLFILAFFASQPENTRRIEKITPEGFLVFIAGLVLYYFGKYLYDKNDQRPLYFSMFLLGIGFASKLTILPLGIFVVLYPFFEFIRKRINSDELFVSVIKYIFFILAGFIAGVIVLGRRIVCFFHFLYRCLIHAKIYGQGDIGFDLPRYLKSLVGLVNSNYLIFFIGLLVVIFLLHGYFRKKKYFLEKEEVWLGLIGIVSFTIYLFVVAKHLRGRYMIIGFLLAAFAVCLILPTFLADKRLKHLRFVILIVALGYAFNAYQSGMDRKSLDMLRKQEVEELEKMGKLDLENDKIVCPDTIPTKKSFFLKGSTFNHKIYDKVIEKYQPNFYLYRFRSNKIHVKKTRERNKVKEYKLDWDYAIMRRRDTGNFMRAYPSRIAAEKGRFVLLENIRDKTEWYQ